MQENAREIFAKNLQRHLIKADKSQVDLVRDLGFKQATVSDWVKGKKYPRVDKMQTLADYFGVLMSDLTEEKPALEDELSEDKARVVEIVRGLTDHQAKLARNYLDLLIQKDNL